MLHGQGAIALRLGNYGGRSPPPPYQALARRSRATHNEAKNVHTLTKLRQMDINGALCMGKVQAL